MQYMMLIYTPVEGGPAPEQLAAEYPRWMQYTQDLQESGVLVAGDALQGLDTATAVRVRNDETLVTDGPFAETKEMLGGYYLIDVPDLDTALAWAAKIPSVGYGSVEVRPIMVFDQS
ncbi:MAG TPA: YciI family protein [Baekduia sp.]|uniref:YciI family protein n=1 Tax=Baekduia sp. TaxID=2600305 RepID=UPI002C9A0A42|nr:YciI family protein [Baekduia sp.]HMJ36491.1 YciI family protein [Baekduia sp.]